MCLLLFFLLIKMLDAVTKQMQNSYNLEGGIK